MRAAAWVASADRALALATAEIRLIRAVTPNNADSELAELETSFARGERRLPAWRYDPFPIRPELRRALDALADFLDKEPPLGPIYAERARELGREAAIIEAVGTPQLHKLARERFLGTTEQDRGDRVRAHELALEWTAAAPSDANVVEPEPARTRSCDAHDPRSLVSRMAIEVGRRRLPVRVLVQEGLASLAATADGAILVAPHRWLTERDVERTVLHEIAGHALPRARASRAALAIFAFGSARGIDDQEGRALVLEEDAGFLDTLRRRELGLRHLAAEATLEGGAFDDIVTMLAARAAPLPAALRIAARVQRGCHGVGGLAREIVYLPARLRVGRAQHHPEAREIEAMMRSGRIAADVALRLAGALALDFRIGEGRRDLPVPRRAESRMESEILGPAYGNSLPARVK